MTENLYEMVNQKSEACPTEDMELTTLNSDCTKELENTTSQKAFTEIGEDEGAGNQTTEESKWSEYILCDK